MIRDLDNLLFECVYEPFCDAVSVRWGRDNWWLARQSLIGSVALYLVMLIVLVLPTGQERQVAPALLNAIVVLNMYRQVFAELGDARRAYRHGAMNSQRNDSFVKRMIIIVVAILSPPLMVGMARLGLVIEGMPLGLAIMLVTVAFFLLISGHYLMACAPRPPRRKPAAVSAGMRATIGTRG
jgi:hypothetical protein